MALYTLSLFVVSQAVRFVYLGSIILLPCGGGNALVGKPPHCPAGPAPARGAMLGSWILSLLLAAARFLLLLSLASMRSVGLATKRTP